MIRFHLSLAGISVLLFRFLKGIIVILQIIILFFSDIFFSIFFLLFFPFKKRLYRRFVIAATEVSKNLYYLKLIYKDAYNIYLYSQKNRLFFASVRYDFGPYNFIFSIFYGPILLAYFSNISDIFVYVWHTGFIIDRKFDYIYLKKIKRKFIVDFFVGDDIRSIKRCKDFFNSLDYDSACNYYNQLSSLYDSKQYEKEKIYIAELADKYADIIFTYTIDNYSYLSRKDKIFPIIRFIDIKEYSFELSKFDNLDNIVIVHAPSSPIIKGTPLVRAAIKKLKEEGYKFEYIELINKTNEKVKEILSKSHIVLNQFYYLSTGFFGIEALATGNAVLMSADANINSDFPEDALDAWLITPYWKIYDNLKLLLDKKELIKRYALSGRKYVEKYHTLEYFREYSIKIFAQKGIL